MNDTHLYITIGQPVVAVGWLERFREAAAKHSICGAGC
jgi:hypothetical protein